METKTISNTCKLITGLSNQTVNLFQDESEILFHFFGNTLATLLPTNYKTTNYEKRNKTQQLSPLQEQILFPKHPNTHIL